MVNEDEDDRFVIVILILIVMMMMMTIDDDFSRFYSQDIAAGGKLKPTQSQFAQQLQKDVPRAIYVVDDVLPQRAGKMIVGQTAKSRCVPCSPLQFHGVFCCFFVFFLCNK